MSASGTGLTTDHPASEGPGTTGRTVIRTVGGLLAVALVVGAAVNFVGWLGRESRTDRHEWVGIRSLDIDVQDESVRVTVGSGSSTTLQRRASWAVTEPRFTMRRDGDRLVIRSRCGWSLGPGCGGSLRFAVPAATSVRVHTSDGAVEVREVTGPVRATTSYGSIRATGLSAALTLRSSDGSIEATGLTSAQVEAHSSDGSMRLGFDAPPTSVTARSSDGSVLVRVPPGSGSYDVQVRTSDGSRSVRVPTDPGSTRHIDVRTSDGSVRVE